MFCEENKILFVHIPKTAGSTVELLLEPFSNSKVELVKRAKEKYDWDDDVEVHVKQRGVLHAKHWTLKEHVSNWMINLDNVHSFTVVRNPYERMIKLFLFKIQNGEFKPKTNEPGYAECLVKPRGKHITEAIVNNWSHSMFAEFLTKKRDLNKMGVRTFSSAWDHCVTGNKRLGVRHIVKYEKLLQELPEVFEKMNLPRPTEIPVTNSTQPLSEEQLRSFYNKNNQLRVEQLWGNDFEPFGYEKWK